MPFLTESQWALIAPLLPRRRPHPRGGRPWADDRACLEGILWILRTGARWRDLPRHYPSPANPMGSMSARCGSNPDMKRIGIPGDQSSTYVLSVQPSPGRARPRW
jgi:hypothetical protein